MKIKYKPGAKVKTVSGKACWINTIEISYLGAIYNIWDGDDKYMNVDEWQIEPYEGNPIGFKLDYET